MKQRLLLLLLIFSMGAKANAVEESPAVIARELRELVLKRSTEMPQLRDRESAVLRLCLPATDETTLAARAEIAMNDYRLDDACAQLADLRKRPLDAGGMKAWVRWLFLSEDYATLDSLANTASGDSALMAERQMAGAELNYRLLQYAEATVFLDRLEPQADHDDGLRARRALILGKINYKQNKTNESLTALLEAFNAGGLDAEILYHTGLTLIKLGRANDAIDIFEEAIRWNPLHEGAHYFLGNGYARLNYAQLADSATALGPAATLVRAGSGEWAGRHYDAAITAYRDALRLVPAYGRAHNGLARALEGKRMLVSINRAADEAIFDAQAMPDVPDIERYVANWDSLTPRHRKQVALAVEPWRQYIPLLVECGSRHYIKPLHEKLSECPNLESLKDQRITYDSRLWDDVRGCGGFTTVTGVEDVERSIYFAYNTVLHELTHQVHGCFPPDDLRELDDAYQAARLRDDGGTPTYMSRYQASSVWEYFAEGANAYYSPKRNRLDTREIVRERLLLMDTTLVRLVEYFVRAPHLEACWPVGLCNAADDAVEKPELDRAVELAHKAQQRAAHDEVVLSTLSRLHSLRNEDEYALAYADTFIRLYPETCRSYLRMSDALYTAKLNCAKERLDLLQLSLMGTDTSDRERVFQALGILNVQNGQYDDARSAYQWILERHPTDYQANWGMAAAYRKDAKADEHFRRALDERTGIPELRCGYARYLFETDRDADARQQIKEAELLAPQHGMVLALKALDALKQRQWADALRYCEESLQTAAAPRLAAVLRAKALKKSGKSREAERVVRELRAESTAVMPEWVYDPLTSNFVLKNEWSADLKEMLTTP
jgi:tetratricopeptide (TPR) repeat protein